MIIITFCLLMSATVGAGEPFFRQRFLFGENEQGYDNFRIPAIVVTPKGTILAFCEGRSLDSDTGDIDLIMTRSFDNGTTWEPIRVVRNDGLNACGNPCPVVDRETGTVFLVHTHNYGFEHESEIIKGTSQGTRRVWVTGSSDEGETWTEPVEITASTKAPNWTWYATGPGVGIQLASGRLIVPCDHTEAKTYFSKAHVIYSDDHGDTWRLGGTVDANFLAEPQVVELADGTLMLNCRNCDSRLFFVMPFPTIDHVTHFRTVVTSANGGLSWGEAYQDPVLTEPGFHGCQESILRYTTMKSHGRNRLLFSYPAGRERREKMTVRLSYDEGITWPIARMIDPGPSGYSCLAILSDGTIACLHERFTGSPNDQMALSLFNLEWLSGGADSLPDAR